MKNNQKIEIGSLVRIIDDVNVDYWVQVRNLLGVVTDAYGQADEGHIKRGEVKVAEVRWCNGYEVWVEANYLEVLA
jgi:hypothetical protein